MYSRPLLPSQLCKVTLRVIVWLEESRLVSRGGRQCVCTFIWTYKLSLLFLSIYLIRVLCAIIWIWSYVVLGTNIFFCSWIFLQLEHGPSFSFMLSCQLGKNDLTLKLFQFVRCSAAFWGLLCQIPEFLLEHQAMKSCLLLFSLVIKLLHAGNMGFILNTTWQIDISLIHWTQLIPSKLPGFSPVFLWSACTPTIRNSHFSLCKLYSNLILPTSHWISADDNSCCLTTKIEVIR